jgi:signal transduction histidine kinase/CheY-like chemotaxis protein
MLRELVGLGQDRLLPVAVRLVMDNVRGSVIPAALLVAVVYWVLHNPSNAVPMLGWAVFTVGSKLVCWQHARHYLGRDLAPEAAHRLVWQLVLLNALDGIAWGSLVWVTLDTSSLAGSTLVLAVIAGVSANAMALNSAVPAVFMAFALGEAVVVMSKLFLMPDVAFRVLGWIGFLYFGNMLSQSLTIARLARRSISLRFENLELLEKLRLEADAAHAARIDSDAANKSKSKFLAAASHDLRQPIHALGLFLEVLSNSHLDKVQRDVLTNARSVLKTSSQMLDILLDFSRIEAGVIEAHPETFRLQVLLNKLETELAPQANAKGLLYRTRETRLLARSDPALVEMILRNLITNAIRYTDQGGVLVACRLRANRVIVEVWDTGIGIDPDEHRIIFQEFLQLGNSERDHRKGLGLGLAIADGLARQLKHELSLASQLGRGSVFRLALPLGQGTEVVSTLESAPVSPPQLDMCVLVIEDDQAVREATLLLLKVWGCRAQAVESIEEALASARQSPPDVVITDYRLREQRTGTQAIDALRAELGEHLPAILITGDTDPERLRDVHDSATHILHKPISTHQLHTTLWSLQRQLT